MIHTDDLRDGGDSFELLEEDGLRSPGDEHVVLFAEGGDDEYEWSR